MIEFIEHLLTVNMATGGAVGAIFGAILGALGSIGGAMAQGAQNDAQIKASVQNNKLQAATSRLNTAVQAQQQASENQLSSVMGGADRQTQALENMIAVLRQSILR